MTKPKPQQQTLIPHPCRTCGATVRSQCVWENQLAHWEERDPEWWAGEYWKRPRGCLFGGPSQEIHY